MSKTRVISHNQCLLHIVFQGSIPETVHLSDVQKYLYQIQQTLLKHNMFWKSVLVFLESLKSETFSNEHFIEENELKEIVLMHIDLAQEVTYTLRKRSVADYDS